MGVPAEKFPVPVNLDNAKKAEKKEDKLPDGNENIGAFLADTGSQKIEEVT